MAASEGGSTAGWGEARMRGMVGVVIEYLGIGVDGWEKGVFFM